MFKKGKAPSRKVRLRVLALGKSGTTVLLCFSSVGFLLSGLTLNYSEIKIPLKRDASGPEGCSDTSGMD